jgi:hypothetical protein
MRSERQRRWIVSVPEWGRWVMCPVLVAAAAAEEQNLCEDDRNRLGLAMEP